MSHACPPVNSPKGRALKKKAKKIMYPFEPIEKKLQPMGEGAGSPPHIIRVEEYIIDRYDRWMNGEKQKLSPRGNTFGDILVHLVIPVTFHSNIARLVDTAAVNRSEGKDTGNESGLHLRILPESFLDFDYYKEGSLFPFPTVARARRGEGVPIGHGTEAILSSRDQSSQHPINQSARSANTVRLAPTTRPPYLFQKYPEQPPQDGRNVFQKMTRHNAQSLIMSLGGGGGESESICYRSHSSYGI
ncbi:hypothetical protein TNCV_2290011 [Trichonephila clavipes]|uniref:Uncharacterized protein n=1 Tax=Trichonephila clavipes TaxID=2585209 RepID=A0A8X6RR94_TRICX|nr:hypothetical protein TNCV_2290011 [Trichonephila clavipes]